MKERRQVKEGFLNLEWGMVVGARFVSRTAMLLGFSH
jgi:hypothetical protein